jgi:ribosomal protein L37AE/L43A
MGMNKPFGWFKELEEVGEYTFVKSGHEDTLWSDERFAQDKRYIPLYTTPQDQADRIAELEKCLIAEQEHNMMLEETKPLSDDVCNHCDGKGCKACDARFLPLSDGISLNSMLHPHNKIDIPESFSADSLETIEVDMKIEALKLADDIESGEFNDANYNKLKASQAIRRLAEELEPFNGGNYICPSCGNKSLYKTDKSEWCVTHKCLYQFDYETKPLSDEEIEDVLFRQNLKKMSLFSFARAIESKIRGEK